MARKKYFSWKAKSNNGVIIVCDYWDWCLMDTYKQNYIEQGHTEEEADSYFWKQVENYDKNEWNRALDGRTIEEALGKGALDDVRANFLQTLDISAEKISYKMNRKEYHF